MGYAFTYPVVHYLAHTKIATYTHYPTIRFVLLIYLALSPPSSQLDSLTLWFQLRYAPARL